MAKVSSSAMWSATGMANVQASAIPAYLKDKGLYDSSAFINRPRCVFHLSGSPVSEYQSLLARLIVSGFRKSPVPRRDGKRRYRSWCIFRQQNR